MIFMALYAWRLAKEGAADGGRARRHRDGVGARAAAARLDGLAAAAAHELGTPLSTIAVVAKELASERPRRHPARRGPGPAADPGVRCREILKKLTHAPSEPDPLHARMSVMQLIEEAAEPYRGFGAEIVVAASAPRPATAASPRAGRRAPARASSTALATWSRTPSISRRPASRSRPAGRRARWQSPSPTTARACPPTSWTPSASPTSRRVPPQPRGHDEGWRAHRAGPWLLHRQDPAGAFRAAVSLDNRAGVRSAAPSSRSAGRGKLSSASRRPARHAARTAARLGMRKPAPGAVHN